MFSFHWREFFPPLSSAQRLLQCYHRQKRDRRRCNSQGIPPQSPATRVISQWASSLEWRLVVTLHIPLGKICISFFLFYCEGMLSIVVLWLCDFYSGSCYQGYNTEALSSINWATIYVYWGPIHNYSTIFLHTSKFGLPPILSEWRDIVSTFLRSIWATFSITLFNNISKCCQIAQKSLVMISKGYKPIIIIKFYSDIFILASLN